MGGKPIKYIDPTGENPVLALQRSWSAGQSIGRGFNWAWEVGAGQSLGISVYEWTHDEWEDSYSDPYGGHDPIDEKDALDLADNLTGDESCSLIIEAINTLKNRIKGREKNQEDNCGGDAGHEQRIDILEKALEKLEEALKNCTNN